MNTPQGQVPEAIAGALFDFAGFLTTLPKERAVTLSGAHLATPVVDLLTEWAKTRGLNLDEANVKGWVAALTAAPTNTSTASGAADLPEAGCSKHHLIHCSQCRHDNMVRDLRAENDRLTTQLAALAAGQATAAPAQPAAQQGAAYAALPEKYYLAGGEVPTWDAKQMHAFADRTHALRAPHGQAPAQPVDFTTLGAAMRAIQQAIGLIGDPADERMQAVRRVLRGAVVVAEDSGDIPALPAPPAMDGGEDAEQERPVQRMEGWTDTRYIAELENAARLLRRDREKLHRVRDALSEKGGR